MAGDASVCKKRHGRASYESRDPQRVLYGQFHLIERMVSRSDEEGIKVGTGTFALPGGGGFVTLQVLKQMAYEAGVVCRRIR